MRARKKCLALACALIYLISFTILPAFAEECRLITHYESKGDPGGKEVRWMTTPTLGKPPLCFNFTWEEERLWMTKSIVDVYLCNCKFTRPYIKKDVVPTGEKWYGNWLLVPGSWTRNSVACEP